MLVSELRAWVCHLSGFDTAFPLKAYLSPEGGVCPEMHTQNITNSGKNIYCGSVGWLVLNTKLPEQTKGQNLQELQAPKKEAEFEGPARLRLKNCDWSYALECESLQNHQCGSFQKAYLTFGVVVRAIVICHLKPMELCETYGKGGITACL